MTDREACPHCGDLLVEPTGPIKSDILLVGDWPDWYDIMKGKAFAIGYRKHNRPIDRAGDILRDLLTANSIRWERCRMTNVWLHDKKKAEDCDHSWHVERVFKEMAKAKYVLLMGTTAVHLLLEDASAQAWSGLEILSHDLPKDTLAMGSVKMSTGFGQLGEVKLAIKRFAEMVHEQ